MEQEDTRTTAEVPERGVKGEADEWEPRAKRTTDNAENKAAEMSKPGAGVGVDPLESLGVLRRARRSAEQMEEIGNYDAISGEELREDLVSAARRVEMEMFKKHGAY